MRIDKRRKNNKVDKKTILNASKNKDNLPYHLCGANVKVFVLLFYSIRW